MNNYDAEQVIKNFNLEYLNLIHRKSKQTEKKHNNFLMFFNSKQIRQLKADLYQS